MDFPAPRLPQKILLKDIALLWTGDDDKVLTGCSIFVDSGIIQWVGDHENIPGNLVKADHVVENMSNRIVIPGMVNTHHHMFQSLTKCMARDLSLFEWLSALYPLWSHITPDMVYKSARFAMAELLLSGCTLTTDMLYIYPNGVRLDDTIRAANEIGIRFQPCRGAISVGKSKGGLPPDELVENENAIVDDLKRLIDAYHDSHDAAMFPLLCFRDFDGPCSEPGKRISKSDATYSSCRRH